MPIYEYRCREQGHVFEILQKISDAPVERCTKCNSPAERIISKSSFHLRGGGWYATDYAKPSSASPSGGGSQESGTNKDSDSGKS